MTKRDRVRSPSWRHRTFPSGPEFDSSPALTVRCVKAALLSTRIRRPAVQRSSLRGIRVEPFAGITEHDYRFGDRDLHMQDFATWLLDAKQFDRAERLPTKLDRRRSALNINVRNDHVPNGQVAVSFAPDAEQPHEGLRSEIRQDAPPQDGFPRDEKKRSRSSGSTGLVQ
jgi:hypothetical protein